MIIYYQIIYDPIWRLACFLSSSSASSSLPPSRSWHPLPTPVPSPSFPNIWRTTRSLLTTSASWSTTTSAHSLLPTSLIKILNSFLSTPISSIVALAEISPNLLTSNTRLKRIPSQLTYPSKLMSARRSSATTLTMWPPKWMPWLFPTKKDSFWIVWTLFMSMAQPMHSQRPPSKS